MSRLVLMCGVAGSGKSTYARALEAAGWVRFSVDAEVWDLGYTEAAAVSMELAAEIRAAQRGEIERALAEGRDVVADYSFHSRSQRDEYRALGARCGASVEVVHLDTAASVVRARLGERRGEHQDDFVVSEDLLGRYLRGFQAPGPDEDDVRVIATEA